MDKNLLKWPFLFLFFSFLGNSVSTVFLYVAFVIAIFEVIVCEMEYTFYFSFFLIPNIRILDGTGINFLVNVLMVLPLAKYIIKNRFVFLKPAVLGATVFMIIEGLHIIIVGNIQNIASEVCWLLAYILCSSILLNNRYKLNKTSVSLYLSIGVIFSAVVYLLCNSWFTSNLISNVIDGYRFSAYADDPNFYSLYICLDLALILSIKNKRKLYYVFYFILTAIGILTASKMCMLMMFFLFIVSAMMYYCSNKTSRKDVSFINRILMIFICCFIAFKDIFLEFINNLLKRAGLINSSSISLSKVTTGRSTILTNYLAILNKNWIALFLGYGFQYDKYLGEATHHGAHNTYMDMVLSWGVIGTIIILYFIFYIFNHYRLNIKSSINIVNYLPIMTILINFLDLGCLSATMFWFVIAIAFIGLNNNEYKENKLNGSY